MGNMGQVIIYMVGRRRFLEGIQVILLHVFARRQFLGEI